MLTRTPLHEIVGRIALEPWRKILLDAADRIERNGHAKGALITETGAQCALGAIHNWRFDRGVLTASLRTDASAYASRRLDQMVGNVVKWNNAPERTAEEVITTMRTCALQGIDKEKTDE